METTIITAINNTGSRRTVDLLIGAKVPGKEYYPHTCKHNNTIYLNVCDGDGGTIDPTSGWKHTSSSDSWSNVSRRTKNRRIDDHAIEQYRLAGIPLASATISSPAPVAGSDSNAAAAPAASSGNGLALASVPGAGANTVSGLNNNGFLTTLLSSGWQLVHLPSGPAGAGQYLVNPSNGASFLVDCGNALLSGSHGISFGPHAGAGAGAGPAGTDAGAIPSTPTAASTPSRGGLGGGGAAAAAAAACGDGGGGGAAATAGSGARDGIMKVAAGPAGPGQYLVNPSSGASFPVEGGNAFFSGRGIGFGPNSGAAAVAGGGAIPSTPTAASTPGRGGLGGGGAAIAAAAAANGSGTRDGVKALVPEGWQVIWLAAGPAGPGQYLLDPHGQMVPYVEGSNAFASGHGLGFSPYGAAAMPSTPSSSAQNKVASASAPFFGSFPNNVIGPRRMPTVIPDDVSNVIPSEAPLPPTPGSTAASKKDFDRLTTLLETSIDINKQNQDKNDTNWNNFKAFAGNVDNSFAQFDGKLDGLAEDQKGMKNNIAKNASGIAKNASGIAKNASGIAKNASGIAKNASDIAKLKEFQQKFEASHGQS